MSPIEYFDDFCRRYRPYKNGAWCYEDGCIYRGLQLLHEATGEDRWLAHLKRLCSVQVGPGGHLAGYDLEDFNIDNILAGRVLLPLARLTGEERYRLAALELVGQLERHPRIPAGNYWHKKRYPHQVWLDGLYMGLPFQVEHALATGAREPVDDAIRQFTTALDFTANGAGLHVHGYDDSRKQRWADPKTGRSPAVWARAMGWLAMALVDLLALLPEDESAHPLRERTRAILRAVRDQQSKSGLWLQVMDAETLPGNYEESSASAMFSYAFMRSARLGLFDQAESAAMLKVGLRALDILTETRLVRRQGGTRLEGICLVAGLGALSGPYRDGSPAYYLTEPVVADDAKGVGPLMMAVAEAVVARVPEEI
ncbi:di-trans,poly-cis-decaprenylcistransferase [Pseudorhizobium endolithicum]|uniref:Di-trans,poly-cis-decaprenylcistransferase n=1 Tax=Pseudorhizobium endolithicum TaxID=1191678 RepID=A0ABN7JZB4_9HYPH|nr:glycoside hydrolase family 88 protein [Pseudorhizobium endolithicum]CAD7055158.1 di-trans,poly-cis-decaprenylcistransferase [Pseudorhizobium endolithicum]